MRLQSFIFGVLGFIATGMIMLAVYGIYTSGYEDGFQCATYKVHCK